VQLPGAERKENRELKSSRLEEFRPLSRRRRVTERGILDPVRRLRDAEDLLQTRFVRALVGAVRMQHARKENRTLPKIYFGSSFLTSFRQAGWWSLGNGTAPRAGRLASLAQARRSPATLYPTIPGRLTRLAGASGFMISFRSSRLSDILSMWSPSHGFLTSFRSPISFAFCVGFKVTL
jgi:hypothetical protein